MKTCHIEATAVIHAPSENNSGAVTTFTVVPTADGSSQATISTDFKIHAAPIGWIENVLLKRIFPPIYAAELRLLGECARWT